ncbi:DUF4199 family protein [Siphonobacter sp.]|uniref:DUF4199 family protein n=1 Tax=Siphonobacter sp. TaxID=1869184 RepID=UPI003B3B7E47
MINKYFLRLALGLGLLAGLACFAYFYVLKLTDAMPLGTRRNLGMILMWVAMAFGAHRYWKNVRRPMNFLEIFGFCVLVVLTASFVDGLLVAGYVRYVEPSLVPEFITDLKRLALQDQSMVKEQFGNQKDAGPVDFKLFLEQIEQISPESIFWSNFGMLRMIFHFLYAALVAIWIRKMSASS